ncbi:hypothetical protein PR048_012066 [Dryococelus australis]|uniref:Uncharacterized protein n=1 Tax=Dryococelus australis TaxID=614101 RepID=A0ABQ9HNK0_9NEOP|nr:hypothetical protein PR048_012066 [Dryococelus australis]
MYTWEGQEIEEAAEYKYLGIVLQGDLGWKKQVERVVAKGRRALGMLGRVLKGVNYEEKAYGTMVRPMLEYAEAIWDPYVEVEVRELEKVQRREARWVKGRWRTQGQDDEEEGNYRPSVMKEMGWSSLRDRRKIEWLVRMCRVVNEKGGWGVLHCKLSKGVFRGRGNNSEKLQRVWRTERDTPEALTEEWAGESGMSLWTREGVPYQEFLYDGRQWKGESDVGAAWAGGSEEEVEERPAATILHGCCCLLRLC